MFFSFHFLSVSVISLVLQMQLADFVRLLNFYIIIIIISVLLIFCFQASTFFVTVCFCVFMFYIALLSFHFLSSHFHLKHSF